METVKTRRPLWSLRLALPIVLASVVAAVIWHQNSKPTAATSPLGPPDARDLVSQWHIDLENARIVIRQGALDRTSGENLEPDDRTTHDAPIEEDTARFGYVFEPEHLILTADDENRLVAALLTPASLRPWVGPKHAGVFIRITPYRSGRTNILCLKFTSALAATKSKYTLGITL